MRRISPEEHVAYLAARDRGESPCEAMVDAWVAFERRKVALVRLIDTPQVWDWRLRWSVLVAWPLVGVWPINKTWRE